MEDKLHPKIRECLENLDNAEQENRLIKNFMPANRVGIEIENTIKDLQSKDSKYELSKEDEAERIAFNMAINHKDDGQSYYGPSMIGEGPDGFVVYPDTTLIGKQVIGYWMARAKEAVTPLFSVQYADLVVCFHKEVISKECKIDFYRKVIDGNLDICKHTIAHSKERTARIKRALELSIKINDQERQKEVKKGIIDLEKEFARRKESLSGGFSLQWLLLENEKKIKVSDIEKEEIIQTAESRLATEKDNLLRVEHLASLLAEYYAGIKDENSLMRVLGLMEEAFKGDDRFEQEPLIAVHYSTKIRDSYSRYISRFPKAKEAHDRILQEINSKSIDLGKSFKEVSIDIPVPNNMINAHLECIFGKEIDTKSDIETVAKNFVECSFPKMHQIKDGYSKDTEEFHIIHAVKPYIISGDGQVIANTSSRMENRQHINIEARNSKLMGASIAITLSIAIDKIKTLYKAEEIFSYFEKSLLFQEEDKKYLKYAVDAYWQDNHLVSSHLFVTIIEKGVRNLVALKGGAFFRLNMYGGHEYIPLGRLLDNEVLKGVFKEIDKDSRDIISYLKWALVDTIGMNIRNNCAHGLSREQFFQRGTSDILFHILTLLSLVVIEESDNEADNL